MASPPRGLLREAVAVIGTGSSGVQSIPVIAEQAGHLTVFQRTPQYTVPARHGSIDRRFIEEEVKPNYDAIIEKGKWTSGGSPMTPDSGSALALTEEERNSIFEKFWEIGGNYFIYGSFDDTLSDKKANDIVAEFIRSKIRRRSRTPRPHRNSFHWTTLTVRSGLLWIPTISRPTTVRTSIS